MTVTTAVPRLRFAGGGAIDGAAWSGAASTADRAVLTRARGPVLDVGCGPARHARALAEAGHVVLGIDLTAPAVAAARGRGVPALERCVFGRVPAIGRWGTVLLLDGNLGIGGDPGTLLGRARCLLGPRGRLLAEASPPGRQATRHRARLELGSAVGSWFPWVEVPACELPTLAVETGFALVETWTDDDRWFSHLERT